MKKILSTALFSFVYLSLIPAALAAPQPVGNNGGSGGDLCPSLFSSLCNGSLTTQKILSNFISFIFILAVVIALLYLIWGGFKWLTSGGDKTAVGAAREHILAAIVGIILIFLSYFILNLILSFFVPGLSLNSIKIPTINQ